MIVSAIIPDKLRRVCACINARIFFADIIVIQFVKNTPTFLIERSVMFGFKIPAVTATHFDYFFEFGKDVDFVVLVENIFGRTGENVCLVYFKLGVDALYHFRLIIGLFAVIVLL